jgi:hypothetical protein
MQPEFNQIAMKRSAVRMGPGLRILVQRLLPPSRLLKSLPRLDQNNRSGLRFEGS